MNIWKIKLSGKKRASCSFWGEPSVGKGMGNLPQVWGWVRHIWNWNLLICLLAYTSFRTERDTAKAGRDLQRSWKTGRRHAFDSGGWSTVPQGSGTVGVGRFLQSLICVFHSKPSGAAEACLRALLRWLLTRLHRVQTMPSPEGSPSVGPRSVVGFCDASWNVAAVSGGVLMF